MEKHNILRPVSYTHLDVYKRQTLPCCLTNGAEGYYPMKEAYDEGGYEARSSKIGRAHV